jgi:predicted phosphodiesterase
LKLGYISDLHVEFYNENLVPEVMKNFNEDKLVIAGDTAVTPIMLSNTIDAFFEHGIKTIFLVLGNHEFFQKDNLKLEEKFKLYKDVLKSKKNVFLLDGDIIEIEGKRIFGFNPFYDSSYLKNKYPYLSDSMIEKKFNEIYTKGMADHKFIALSDMKEWHNKELEKLKKIDKVDLIISHVKPVNIDRFFARQFRGSDFNTMFSFNGTEFFYKTDNWIFGHTHNPTVFELAGVKFFSNPLGYPGERKLPDNIIEIIEI